MALPKRPALSNVPHCNMSSIDMLSDSGIRIRTFVGVGEISPIERSKRFSWDPKHSREMEGSDGKEISGSESGDTSCESDALDARGGMKRLGVFLVLVGSLCTGNRFFRGVARAYSKSSTESSCVLSAICPFETTDCQLSEVQYLRDKFPPSHASQ